MKADAETFRTGDGAVSRKKKASQRPRHPMPEYVRKALEERELVGAYENRPPYQQNDYLGWIAQAKRDETITKRLRQMLDELREGTVYMKMKWNPQRRGPGGN